MKRRTLLSIPALVPAAWLSACGGGSSGNANVRLVNASLGFASLDLYNSDTNGNLTAWITGVAYGTGSDYKSVSAGNDSIVFTNTGNTSSLLTQSRTLNKDAQYSIVTYTVQGLLKSTAFIENIAAANANQTKVSVLSEAGDTGLLDVYLLGSGDVLASSTPVFSNVSGPTSAPLPYSVVTAQTYRLVVTAAGQQSDVRLDVSGVVLASTKVVTVVLTPGASGMLVNALQLEQGGAVTPLLNTQARVRVISAVVNNPSVSLTIGGQTINTQSLPTIVGYASVNAGTLSVTGTVGGVAQNFGNVVATAGNDVTLFLYGDLATSVSMTAVVDDNRLPTNSSNVKVRLVNGIVGIGPLTMTVDSSIVASGISTGQVSAYNKDVVADSAASIEVLSTTGRVVAIPNATDTTSKQLVATHLYTMYMYGTTAAPSYQWVRDR